jgi:hypothetical protein
MSYTNPIARTQLALLLENEARNAAASEILCGKDPVAVLREIVEQPPRYQDNDSELAMATFREIIDGTTVVH